jgi:hypothetical protein
MTVRIFWRRSDGFGECRNIYDVTAVVEDDTLWRFPVEGGHDDRIVRKSEMVGLPQIVEARGTGRTEP